MKIDLTKIEGYETMSAEDKLKALEDYDFDTKGFVKKETFDKTASELAALKKKDRENLSEVERLQAEHEDSIKKMQEELQALRMEKQLGELKANYLSLGYDDKLANDTAKAFMDGDMAKVFDNQKKYQAEIEKKVKAELLKNTPDIKGGSGDKMTPESFRKLSPSERLKFSVDHPEEYKAIYEN